MSDSVGAQRPVRKKLNRVALVLFVLAALLVVLDIASGLLIQPVAARMQANLNLTPVFIWSAAVGALREAIYGAGLLTALGALIELVDRVLWRLTPEAERPSK